MTQEDLLKIYDLVFSSVHSNGFKISEIKDLLFNDDYWFLERPKDDWHKSIIDYLDSINYDKSLLKINPKIIT